jgi:tetratricopeptide (TPR) repeat protein
MRFVEAVLLAAMTAGATSAGAAVTTLGGGHGRDCYEAAEYKRSEARSGIAVCTLALETEALNRRDRAATLINRGIIQMRERNLAAAIADYDAALRADNSLAEGYVNRGIALVHLGGRDRDAIADLSRGIAMNPSRPEVALYTRGVAHELAGDLRQAYEDYSAAAALKPDWTDPAEQLKRFNVERRKVGRG